MGRKLILLMSMYFLILLSSNNANAQSIKFALVPKQTSIDFFDEIAKGCQDAAQKHSDVECIYKGPPTSDFRLQDRIVSELIDQGVAGIAISVINSEYLVANSLKKAKQYGIPVLTFDSDLSQDTLKKHPNLRSAYVGTDNHALGQELARALLEIKPEGIYALISGNRTAPNLHDRIVGFRDGLKNSNWKEFPPLSTLYQRPA
jgi:ribose transport system substrate-binding protein